MKFHLFLLIGSILLLSGCKSKESVCHCATSEVQDTKSIETIPFELSFSPLVCLDIATPYVSGILPDISFNVKSFSKYSHTSSILPISLDIIDKAFKFQGVRYRRGGTSFSGFDCSGLVYTCFSAFGISLPRSSVDMAKSVPEISRKDAQIGDLIFFKTNRRKGQINHVGLIVEVNSREIKFIHASIKSGVIVSSTLEDYYSRTYAKIGRVSES